jgi:ribosomal protein L24E
VTIKTVRTCDQCGESIRGWMVQYANEPLPGTTYATHDGARYNWQFCSDGCLATWLTARERERLEWDRKAAEWHAKHKAG